MIVYTAIMGYKDTLTPPTVDLPEGVKAVCFTDLNSSVFPQDRIAPYKIESVSPYGRNSYVKQRHVKTYWPPVLSLEGSSLFMDSNIRLTVSIPELMNEIGGGDFVLIKHPWRRCLYEEAEAVKSLGLDDPKIVDAQVNHYRKEGCPENLGLYACGMFFRRHTKVVKQVSRRWFQEISRWSHRDQISLPYVLWATDFHPTVWNINLCNNRFFRVFGHAPRPK